jgi:hypothetical protein
MKKSVCLVIAILVSISFSVTNSYGQNIVNKNQTKVDSAKTVYTCPMHSEIKSDKPGKCTKCGMDLVKKEQKTEKIVYACPMHPEVISDNPGKCSKCGMDLVNTSKGIKKGGHHSCCSMK